MDNDSPAPKSLLEAVPNFSGGTIAANAPPPGGSGGAGRFSTRTRTLPTTARS